MMPAKKVDGSLSPIDQSGQDQRERYDDLVLEWGAQRRDALGKPGAPRLSKAIKKLF